MVNHKYRKYLQLSWPWWRWILLGLSIIALILSAIMSWHSLVGGSMLGCGGGSPCDQVLSSRWSMLAGVLPISGLAVGVYLAILVASFFIGNDTEIPIRRLAWSAILILAGSIAGSAIWFTIVQKWIIGNFCPYCMTTHITGFLLTILVIWRAFKEFENQPTNIPLKNNTTIKNVSSAIPKKIIHPLHAIGLVLIGLALAGILAISQVSFTSKAVYSEAESQDNLPTLDYYTVPMVGSPDAPYIVTLLFDYQCSHCQKIHFMLNDAINRYDGKLAFALCPAPLNTQCNPYIPRDVDAFKNSCELAKIGLAIWVADQKMFPAFENWMFSFDSGDYWLPRSLESVKAKAVELVGQEIFDAALTNPWTIEYLQITTQIYGQTIQSGKGGIPKMIFGSRWVIPEPYNADDLVMILQKSLAVPNP